MCACSMPAAARAASSNACATSLPGALVCGVELDRAAARVARDKSGAAIVAGSVERLPFADGAFDAVFSADVLCHRGVAQESALAEFRRCLRPGGVLVLNLPAYRWLFSAHDIAVDNVRRYGAGEVRDALAGAGFAASPARALEQHPLSADGAAA